MDFGKLDGRAHVNDYDLRIVGEAVLQLQYCQ
jgi:hypothetical protein